MAKSSGRGVRDPRHEGMWTRPNTSSGLFMQSQRRGGAFAGLCRHRWPRRWFCRCSRPRYNRGPFAGVRREN